MKQNELDLGSALCANVVEANTYAKRVKVAAKWCEERHKVYIKKERGDEKPWTTDWIMRSSRFTNVYRELDRVTVEIMREWIKPNLKNENLALVALAGRLINYTDTLVAIRNAGLDFQSKRPNTERLFDLFQKIKRNKGQLVTGAYIVNTVFPKDVEKVDGSKADYIANFFWNELWAHRDELNKAMRGGSFRGMIDAYKKVHGIGVFIANQAAVDLTYTKFLHGAPDIDDTWNPGPGTTRGINWIHGVRGELKGGSEKMDKALTAYREDLNHELSKSKLWTTDMSKMKTRLVPVSGPNASNTLCELSKWTAMALGTRDRLKNRYPGA